jgi:hypothetical protein
VAGDWIAYRVTGKIVALRVYAFGAQDAPGLEFRAGDDGQGKVLVPQTQDYYAGKEMYNFKWPRLYSLTAWPGDEASVTIQFRNETQIARVEIEYQ